MDKQAWTAVLLSIVGLVAWQYYVTTKYPPAPVAAHSAAVAPGTAAANAPASSSAGPAPSPLITSGKPEVVADRQAAAPTPTPAAEAAVPEQIETVTTPQIELHFTNQGGGIAEAVPLGKQHVVDNGADKPVNIQIGHAGHTPIGAISAKPDDDTRLPYTLRRDGTSVRAERTEPNGLKITKEYSLDWQGDTSQIPVVKMKVSFTNTGAQPYKNDGYYVHTGAAGPIHRRDLPNYTAFDWYTGNKFHTDHATSFEAGHVPLLNIKTHDARASISTPLTKASWVAVKNQFYATILTPLDTPGPDQEPLVSAFWARPIDLPLTPEETAENAAPLRGVDAALGLPGFSLAPGESKVANFQIYAGPKYYARLAKLGHQEQEVMDYGMFKVVSIVLLGLMNTFKSWLGNYALAIILLTICVKGVLYPLQNKANKSMKRMSALSPKLTELREKYKDDPMRINTETMKLYKAHGVSPLGGCLPMFIQMPIFFGFLYMLYPAAELRNAGFLWVHDLSQPDTVAHVAGFAVNVLPLLMIGTQFWQMSLTPKTGDAQQQKTLMFMPLIFGFVCYNFAAALALYYTMQGLLTILQLYITRTHTTGTDADSGGAPAGKFVPVRPGTSDDRRFKGGTPKRLKT